MSISTNTLRVILIGFVLFFIIGSPSAIAHGDEDHDSIFPAVEVCRAVSEERKDACYSELCDGSTTLPVCIEDIIEASLNNKGAEFTKDVLYDLEQISLFSPYIYEGIYRMGAWLFLEYGGTADAFSQCPSDFRYGCIDGFFEAAVAAASSSARAGGEICATAQGMEMSMHCYHRMGHAFMKHSKHIYKDALALCSAAPDNHTADCWDGVFMEGVHQQLDRGGVELFDYTNDVLAPCSVMDEQYREACYTNHGLYLVQMYGGDHEKAMQVCADVAEYSDVCNESVMGGGHDDHHKGDTIPEKHSHSAMEESEHSATDSDGSDRDTIIDTIFIAYVVLSLSLFLFLGWRYILRRK